jgi:hypothetical protein
MYHILDGTTPNCTSKLDIESAFLEETSRFVYCDTTLTLYVIVEETRSAQKGNGRSAAISRKPPHSEV